jgi:hypothetical protein
VNDTFDYIMRFVVILFGYCCGLLATGWFLAAILFRSIGVDALMDDFAMMAGASNTEAATLWATTSFWSSVFVGGFVVAMLAGGISFLPAAIVILLVGVLLCGRGSDRSWNRGNRHSVSRIGRLAGNAALDCRLRGRGHCRRLHLLADCRPQCRTAFRPPGRVIKTQSLFRLRGDNFQRES